jgi:uncharacterized repeat protein (TIGR01451 family)
MSAPRSVTATFVVLPKLFSIALSHSADFTRGKNATYTVAVSNISKSATAGTVTVGETVPGGMTLVSMAGKGWTCATGASTCTRSDSLGAGASYPAITVTVGIAAHAGSPLVNSVSVSGGGSATVTASDSVVIRN